MLELQTMRRPRREPEKVYIRFGRWSATSKNWATGEQERGVSVYPAVLKDGIVSVELFDFDVSVACLQGRLAFAVTGREVGRGSDGEPVLRGVKALAYAIDHMAMPCGLNEDWSK